MQSFNYGGLKRVSYSKIISQGPYICFYAGLKVAMYTSKNIIFVQVRISFNQKQSITEFLEHTIRINKCRSYEYNLHAFDSK